MKITSRRLAEIEGIPDEAIDTSDIPEASEDFFKAAIYKIDLDTLIGNSTLRRLLSRWVSELPPALCWLNGEIIGLTCADFPPGVGHVFILFP